MNYLRMGLLLVLAFSSQVFAASLAVWPINPRIDAPASATMVWVKNNSATEEIVLQARIFSWRQEDNKDLYDPQDDLVVSPPLVTVKPGTQQVFRVVNRKGAITEVANEFSYRLIIDEIPVSGRTDGMALSFQMRYSLPLFVGLPAGQEDKSPQQRYENIASNLNFRLISKPEKRLEITNNGIMNARLSKVRITTPANIKSVVISEGLLGYVLVGSSRQWPLNDTQWTALQHNQARLLFEQDRQELEIARR